MARRFRAGILVRMVLVVGSAGAACSRDAPLPSAGGSNDTAPQIMVTDAVTGAATTVADAAPLFVDCVATCMGVQKPVGMSPYSMRFRFRNSGATPVFLRAGCSLEYRISSCERCYRDDLGARSQCGSCGCADKACNPNGFTCGQCESDRGVAVAPGGILEDTWTGETQDAARNCRVALPAAGYGLAIRIYETAVDAVKRTNAREVVANFLLGSTAAAFDLDVAAK